MDPKEKEDQKKEAAEDARNKLKNGTWPQVTGVSRHGNPRAPRHGGGDFARTSGIFERAGYANIAAFAELVRLEERRRDMPLSFSLSLRKRIVPGNAEPTAGNAELFLGCPDIFVGTHGGKDAAFEWLENFAKALPDGPPEVVRVLDRIFAEAVELLKQEAEGITMGEMIGKAAAPPHERGAVPPKGRLPN